ncbi:MAG: FtsW/RodA/SpoVE family cell cycle protein [Chloroflexota bacterium]
MPVRFKTWPDWLLVPALIFMLTNAISLALTDAPAPRWGVLLYALVWLAMWLGASLALNYFRPGYDQLVLAIVMLFLGWGMLQVDRLAPDFALRHAMWCVLGTIVLGGTAIIPGKLIWLSHYPYTIMLAGLLLVGITFLLGTAPLGYGPRLWLRIPFLNIFFQPSELLKLIFIVFAAGFFSRRHREVSFESLHEGNQPKRFEVAWLGPLLAMWLFSMCLLVLQQDLGAATLFFFAFMALIYLATGERVYIWGGIGMLAVAAVIATLLYDRVALRMEALINPWPDASGRAFQIVQALYAIGAGGFIGTGIGQGFPNYIPVVHSDFALAAIAEEWGMVGSGVVIGLFAILIWRGFMISMQSQHPFFRYLAAGIAILLGAQTLMIIGGVAKLLPLTGVTLPFVSYGGSSMVVSCTMAGLLLRMSALNSGEVTERASLRRRKYNHRIERMNVAFMTIFAVMFIGMLWWASVQSSWLAVREDNPRTVEAVLSIQRGTIFDVDGNPISQNVGTLARQERQMNNLSFASVVGYASFRFGESGVEEGLNEILNGEASDQTSVWRQEILNYPQIGQDVRLTLESDLQMRAVELLQGQKGALVLMSVNDGAIRSMASSPSFDPNSLEDSFDQLTADEDAPLVNRAVQGNYQVGYMLTPFLVGWGLETGKLSRSELDGLMANDGQNAESYFQTSTAADVSDLVNTFGLANSYPNLPLLQIVEETNTPQTISDAIDGDDAMLISPLQLTLAVANIANPNDVVQPEIVSAIYEENAWKGSINRDTEQMLPKLDETNRDVMLELFESDGRIGYYTSSFESGPDAETESGWFVGLAPPQNPRYVLVILVEDSNGFEQVEMASLEYLNYVLNR